MLFSVEPTNTTQYIARAFFPSSPKSSRNVLVNAASLVSSGNWEPGDILGHELGHTLGFRHEHTRPEAGTCFEDNNWRALTPYDSVSIMHYPQCNGGSSDLEFSSNDATACARCTAADIGSTTTAGRSVKDPRHQVPGILHRLTGQACQVGATSRR